MAPKKVTKSKVVKRASAGRPRTEPEKRFNVRAEADELEQWEARAEILGFNASQWIRQLAKTAIGMLSPSDLAAVKAMVIELRARKAEKAKG